MTPSSAQETLSNPHGGPSAGARGLGHAAPLLLLAAGVLLRLAWYAANRALSHDEAGFALDLLSQPFHHLVESFGGRQPVGIGFLYLEKAATIVFGPGAHALRLLPVLAAVLAVPLFWQVLRRMAGAGAGAAAVCTLALFSFSVRLVSAGADAAPNALDIFLVVLLMHLCLRVLDRSSWGGPGGGGGADALSLAAGAALWFSPACASVVPAIVLALLVTALWRGSWRNTIIAAAVGCFSLLSFAAHHYLMALRSLELGVAAPEQISAAFFPWPQVALAQVAAAPGMVFSALGDLLGGGLLPGPVTAVPALAAAALCVLGFVQLWRGNRRAFWPVTLCLLALLLVPAPEAAPRDAAHLYAVLPLLAMLSGAGLQFLQGRRYGRYLVAGGATLILLPVLAAAARSAVTPAGHDDLRPIIAHIAENKARADVVYLLGDSEPAFRYDTAYGRGLAVRPLILAVGPSDLATAAYRAGKIDEVALLRSITQPLREEEARRKPPQVPRIWIVFAGTRQPEYAAQEKKVLAGLDAAGKCDDAITRPGAAAYLYELP